MDRSSVWRIPSLPGTSATPVLPALSFSTTTLRLKNGPCAPARFSSMQSRPATGMTSISVTVGVRTMVVLAGLLMIRMSCAGIGWDWHRGATRRHAADLVNQLVAAPQRSQLTATPHPSWRRERQQLLRLDRKIAGQIARLPSATQCLDQRDAGDHPTLLDGQRGLLIAQQQRLLGDHAGIRDR